MEQKESYLWNEIGCGIGGDSEGAGKRTCLDLYLEKPKVQWRNLNYKIIVI